MSWNPLLFLCPLIIATLVAVGLRTAVAQDVVLRIEPLAARIPASSGAAVKISVTNKGSQPVTLVRPGDGSWEGQRTPVVEFSWVPRDERKLENPQAPPMEYPKDRCANMQPIMLSEVFRLAPNETLMLQEFMPVRKLPAQPGSYAVVFYYLNLPSMGRALTEFGTGAFEAVRDSLPCLLRSNEVVFNVDPTAPNPDYESMLKGKQLPARRNSLVASWQG